MKQSDKLKQHVINNIHDDTVEEALRQTEQFPDNMGRVRIEMLLEFRRLAAGEAPVDWLGCYDADLRIVMSTVLRMVHRPVLPTWM